MSSQHRTLHLRPASFAEAKRYIADHHRHHKPPQGHKFSIALMDDDMMRGVAVVGRPVARMLDDGYTAEVTRLCTDGVPNGCSMLYAACRRAAKAMGYRRILTYILASESGVSLRAAGWRRDAVVPGRSWDRSSRPRIDKHPTEDKIRWVSDLGGLVDAA